MTGDVRTASTAPAADSVVPSLAAVLDGIDDGLAVLSPDGVVRHANAAFREMVPGEGGSVAGMPLDALLRLVPPLDVAATGLADVAPTWDGRVVPLDAPASETDSDPGFPASLRRLSADSAGSALLLTVRSEAGHGGCRAQLRQAEGAGRLARAAVHELNNVLAAITTFTELLLATRPDSGVEDRDREDLEEIRAAARRGAGITRSVAAFRAEGPLPPEVVDLGAVLCGHRGLVRRLIPADVDLTWDLPPSGPRVRIDPRALDRLVVNLALDLGESPTGGALLRVGTARVDSGPPGGVDGGRAAPAGWIALEVEGAGVGAALAAVGASARVAGVRVEGGADTLRILIPAEDPRDGVPVSSTDGAGSPSESATVLVVEPDPALRAGLRRALAAGGFEVVDARDGAEAVALVGAGRLRPDVVLGEVVAPEPAGAELEGALRASGVDVPMVFLSGRGDHPRVLALRRSGIPVLDKPVPIPRLLTTLREAVDAGRTTE